MQETFLWDYCWVRDFFEGKELVIIFTEACNVNCDSDIWYES